MQSNSTDSLPPSREYDRLIPNGRRKTSLRLLLDLWAGRFFAVFSLLPSILLFFITAVLLYRAWPILATRPLAELLLGQVWRPSSNAFGFLPFIAGSLWVTAVSLILAVPVCLLSAIYLSEYAHPITRMIARPVLDLLAGIPSVIYGLWGVLVIVPWVQDSLAPALRSKTAWLHVFTGSNPTGYSVLAAGLVLAVMVAPFIINLVFEILQTVPNGLKEASLAVGSTHWQTIHKVILPSIRSGVLAAVVLGTSRALGETMAVMMVVGNVPKIPGSVFDPAYPLPALIANSYGEMLSIPLYDSALMTAALILLVMVLLFNLGARLISTPVFLPGITDHMKIYRRSRQYWVENFFKLLMLLSLVLVIASLGWIVFTLLVKGLPYLSLSMLTQTPQGGFYLGKGGGILNAIVGSIYLGVGGTLLALLLSLPILSFLSIYVRRRARFARFVSFCMDILWGIPSIVYGAFAFIIMSAFGLRTSLLGGIITLALLELPIMTRGMDEVVRHSPVDVQNASLALGATRLETLFKVVFKQMLPGMVAAILLAFGRGIGDAASVLFTAGYTDHIPTSLMDPVASLPLAVFFQLSTPFPEVQQRAYASALVLTLIVLFISLFSRWIAARLSRFIIH